MNDQVHLSPEYGSSSFGDEVPVLVFEPLGVKRTRGCHYEFVRRNCDTGRAGNPCMK